MSTLVAAGGSKALWYATRGSGAVALLALTATVVLGVAGGRRVQSTRLPRFVLAGLHRNLTLIALALLAVHIGTAVADSYAPIALKDAVIPFVSAYRPFWLGLGAVAFDLLLALVISSLLRTRIGFRRWRLMHWLAYAAWPVALVHALGAGSDPRLAWMRLLAVCATLAVIAAVLVRLGPPSTWRAGRLAAAGAAVLVPLVTLIWYASGPGRPGWAKRAGTPVGLIARPAAVRRAIARLPAASVPSLPSPPFTARFTGRLHQSAGAPGRVLIDITGKTSGGASGRLWIRLEGVPIGQGVDMTASGASFGPSGWPHEYVGRVAGLDGTRLLLSLRGRTGSLGVLVDLSIDPASGAVSGLVRARPGPGDSE